MSQQEYVQTGSSSRIEPDAPNPKGASRAIDRKQWMFLLRIILLVLFIVIGYKVVRTGLFAMSAYNSASTLRDSLRADLDSGDLAKIYQPVAEIARSASALDREMRLFAPVMRASVVVPRIGHTIAAFPPLLSAGSNYATIGSEVIRLMAEVQNEYPDYSLPQLALASMERYPDTYDALHAYAAEAARELAKIDAAKLHPKLAEPVEQVQSVSVLADAGLQMSPHLAEILGFYGPRNYLLLVQNNHELRATGGFISAVGLVTLENGLPGEIALTDSYNIRRDDVDHPWAPQPMQDYMGIQLIFLRDANWSPDLPTTGTLASALYRQDAGKEVNGVMTVDLRAVELLVAALGPLRVQGSDVEITGDNLVEQIKIFWDQPIETGDTKESAGEEEWWKQRKDFMPALAQAAINRVRSGKFNPLVVADAGLAALDERAIQVWFADPEADSILAEYGWNGSMQSVAGADLLGLVDTNMGYNKVDSVLERSMEYSLTWSEDADGRALAETTIRYRHPIEAPGHVCDQRPRYGDNYDAMTERCYFDYVRLYVPAGSELLAFDGLESESVDVAFGENGTSVLAGYFEMLPGTEHSVTFQYRLPGSIQKDEYSLVIRRQAGSGPLPVSADVDGWNLTTTVVDGQLVWTPATD